MDSFTRFIVETPRRIFGNVFIKRAITCVGVYLTWTFMHYISTILYANFCTPISFYGFAMSAILVSTPHCSALRWMIYNGASKMNAILLVMGGYVLAYAEENWVIR
jgi:hypothetical protein